MSSVKQTDAPKTQPATGLKRKRPTFLYARMHYLTVFNHYGQVLMSNHRSMDQTQVEVILADSKKSFMVYKDLACFHSLYFRGAFEGSSQESKKKSIRLRDVSEQTFRLFQFWLFAQATREEAGPASKKQADGRRPSHTTDTMTLAWDKLTGMSCVDL